MEEKVPKNERKFFAVAVFNSCPWDKYCIHGWNVLELI